MKRFWAASYAGHDMDSKNFWITASEGFWRPSIPTHILYLVYSHRRTEYIVRKYTEKRWSTLSSLPAVPSDKAYRIEERTVIQLLRTGMMSTDTQGLLCRFEAFFRLPTKSHKSPKRLTSKRTEGENKGQTSEEDKTSKTKSKQTGSCKHLSTLSELTLHPPCLEPIMVYLNSGQQNAEFAGQRHVKGGVDFCA